MNGILKALMGREKQKKTKGRIFASFCYFVLALILFFLLRSDDPYFARFLYVNKAALTLCLVMLFKETLFLSLASMKDNRRN